jgi:hypothetical protein
MRFASLAPALLAAALCAGCRADSSQSWTFATDTVATRTQEDVVNTGHAITTLPAVVASSFTDGWKNWIHTAHLYYDATNTPK